MKTMIRILAAVFLVGGVLVKARADEHDDYVRKNEEAYRNYQRDAATRRAHAAAAEAQRQAAEATAIAQETNQRVLALLEEQQRREAEKQAQQKEAAKARARAEMEARAQAQQQAEEQAARNQAARLYAQSQRPRQPGAVSITHRTRSDGTVLVIHDGGSRILPNMEAAKTYMDEVRKVVGDAAHRDAVFAASLAASRARVYEKYPSLAQGLHNDALNVWLAENQMTPEFQEAFKSPNWPEVLTEKFVKAQLAR